MQKTNKQKVVVLTKTAYGGLWHFGVHHPKLRFFVDVAPFVFQILNEQSFVRDNKEGKPFRKSNVSSTLFKCSL